MRERTGKEYQKCNQVKLIGRQDRGQGKGGDDTRTHKKRLKSGRVVDRQELFLIIMSSLQVFGVGLTVGGSYGGERGGAEMGDEGWGGGERV